MRCVVLAAAFSLVAFSCGPQCEQATPTVTSVCRIPGEGGDLQPGTPFIFRALPKMTGGTCTVAVSGSSLSVSLAGTVCSTGGASAKPAVPGPVLCNVPGLDAGTYSISGTNQSVTVPSDGTTFPSCP